MNKEQLFWVLEDDKTTKKARQWWTLCLTKASEAKFGTAFWWSVLLRGAQPPKEPPEFYPCEGSRMASVTYMTSMTHVFSPEMTRLLLDLQCSGFTPLPCKILDRRQKAVICETATWKQLTPGVFGHDESRGFRILVGHNWAWLNEQGPMRGVGLYFDHKTWTGLDMFAIEACHECIVTDRIAQALLASGLDGFQLIRVEEYGLEMRDHTIQRMTKKYGPDWEEKFRPKVPPNTV
jgi:hypothetical protein